ncbi:MAG: 50S ribosomal protein L10 [bacterium]|nr:50S ribosomal protein L10 [bacterium]
MNRVEKQEQIDFLKNIFADSESVVLSSVQGLNATEISSLRKNLHEAGVGFKVIKNKLARIAAANTPVQVLNDDFINSTAIAWSAKDAVAPAKILVKFKKEIEKFELKAGYNAGKRLAVADINAFANMPSLEELRAQMLGTLLAVPAKLLAQIQAPASHIIGVVNAKVEKEKESV